MIIDFVVKHYIAVYLKTSILTKHMKKIIGILCLIIMLVSCNDSDRKGSTEDMLKEGQFSSLKERPETKGVKSPKNRISKEEAVQSAVKQFENYLPNILKTYDAGIDLQEPFVGDFTGDGIEDVAIYWSLAPKGGGNAIVGQGISLYKNNGHNVKVIAGYEPDYLFAFDTISNGKIIVEKLEYAEDDGRCCPSIKSRHELTISGNKAY